jgi:hypothetical protein
MVIVGGSYGDAGRTIVCCCDDDDDTTVPSGLTIRSGDRHTGSEPALRAGDFIGVPAVTKLTTLAALAALHDVAASTGLGSVRAARILAASGVSIEMAPVAATSRSTARAASSLCCRNACSAWPDSYDSAWYSRVMIVLCGCGSASMSATSLVNPVCVAASDPIAFSRNATDSRSTASSRLQCV